MIRAQKEESMRFPKKTVNSRVEKLHSRDGTSLSFALTQQLKLGNLVAPKQAFIIVKTASGKFFRSSDFNFISSNKNKALEVRGSFSFPKATPLPLILTDLLAPKQNPDFFIACLPQF